MEKEPVISLNDKIHIEPKRILALYLQQKHHELSEYFLSVFSYFQQVSHVRSNPQLENFVNTFMQHFLFIFSQPDFQVSKDHALAFIKANAVIANLTALSEFKTTDSFIPLMKNQAGAFIKVLTLYSARNRIRISRKTLFDAHPALASAWYVHFFDLYTTSFASPNSFQHFRQHLHEADERFEALEPVVRPYFGCTYVDGNEDKHLKHILNAAVKRQNDISLSFDESYQNNKIAVFSACWKPTHAVYKNQFRYIEALKESYEVHFYPLRDKQNTEEFHHVDTCCINGTLHLENFLKNKYRMLYLPDIGMSQQSIMLANMRLAPIQACAFGHSVSTHGADMDYYIVGEEIEDLSRWEENYSERLVVLPGLGIIHKKPPYERKFPPCPTEDVLTLSCPASVQKCNFPMLRLFREIIKQSKVKVHFRVFVGTGMLRDSGFLPCIRDIHELLGKDNVQIVTHQPYERYMEQMEEGDFALDSFHFGGCNTVIDALYLGKPIVTLRGTKWYNRIGPQQLVHLGLEELVADNENEYLEKVLHLIHDKKYREELSKRIEEMDILHSELFDEGKAWYFRKAIDFLFSQHEELLQEGSREPIRISPDT